MFVFNNISSTDMQVIVEEEDQFRKYGYSYTYDSMIHSSTLITFMSVYLLYEFLRENAKWKF